MVSQDRATRPGVTNAAGENVPHVSENRFRQKRFAKFRALLDQNFAGKSTIRVLDIGGARNYWNGLKPLWADLPLEITIINIGAEPVDDTPYFIRPGDACDLSHYADNSFDIVHSNSVIEHVGHWPEIEAMAREVRRLAPHYYLQTPNIAFPYEPHFRSLFIHWYPEAVRAQMLLRRRRGFIDRQPDMNHAMLELQAINLLSTRQMKHLFPDARIEHERILGLSKSIIAIR
ncbi:class I SAM-dependent methyltransferase [Sphingobium sp. H39-3-25]|uniref:class I SAM-dependent methyltransferase n=1 Tax=Sphingobium arseniciresistens TaxID=3030834 RepID=UPI0023B9DDCD|nr:class I SAM-dependent methyltransferase [Sphingobium arseniciresistens]